MNYMKNSQIGANVLLLRCTRLKLDIDNGAYNSTNNKYQNLSNRKC